jgi:site-specific DNA recombinase
LSNSTAISSHEADERLRRVYKAMEDGIAEMDDLLRDRIPALKADRDRVRSALARVRSGLRPAVDISPIVVERFGQAMRDKLTTGEVPLRKAYLGVIVDRVEVDDRQIRIVGRKDVLEQAVLANGGPVPGVHSFVRKWRSLRESNPSFQIEKRNKMQCFQAPCRLFLQCSGDGRSKAYIAVDMSFTKRK